MEEEPGRQWYDRQIGVLSAGQGDKILLDLVCALAKAWCYEAHPNKCI